MDWYNRLLDHYCVLPDLDPGICCIPPIALVRIGRLYLLLPICPPILMTLTTGGGALNAS